MTFCDLYLYDLDLSNFFFLLNLLNCITENDCMFEALNYKFMHLHTI